MIDQHFGFDPKRETTHDACVQLCLANQFDPVVEHINSLEWDGIERLDEWIVTYLGAKDTVLNRAIGRIALIAQVRRARSPGCKFDQIIVLESAEGELRSTALLVLAGGPENFSDQTILGQGVDLAPRRLRTERHEAEFRQFQAWARAFGYRELPAHGAVVAGYLMAIMSEIG